MKFCSIIPLLIHEEGHAYPYNLAVKKACELNAWEHLALIPKQCTISDLPEGWKKSLVSYGLSRSFFEKLSMLILNTPLLAQLIKKHQISIVFMEQFALSEFLALSLAVFFTRANVEVWLLHRFDLSHKRVNRWIYSFFQNILGKKLKLLTDSKLLQNDLFKKTIHLLPIPHTCDFDIKKRATTEMIFWWPTSSKGLSEIQRVVAQPTQGVRLIATSLASSHLNHSKIPITFIPTPLPRSEYVKWMRCADFVLLPYDQKMYERSTSGIFVEAIIAGSIPIVTKGTWMAQEYEYFDLREFIVDWREENLINHLKTLTPSVKLMKMQNHYKAFHSTEKLADSFKTLKRV